MEITQGRKDRLDDGWAEEDLVGKALGWKRLRGRPIGEKTLGKKTGDLNTDGENAGEKYGVEKTSGDSTGFTRSTQKLHMCDPTISQ